MFVRLSKHTVLFLFLLESLIGETYVEKIIDKLQAALSKARDLSEAGNTEPSVSFICDVASSFFSSVKGCLLMPSSEDLLLTIFQLCAQRQDATHLTGNLKKKIYISDHHEFKIVPQLETYIFACMTVIIRNRTEKRILFLL